MSLLSYDFPRGGHGSICLCGEMGKAWVASVFGLWSLLFSGTCTTLAASPFGHCEVMWSMWATGFWSMILMVQDASCLNTLVATWSWAGLQEHRSWSLDFPVCIPHFCKVSSQLSYKRKIRSQRPEAWKDNENTKQYIRRCLWFPVGLHLWGICLISALNSHKLLLVPRALSSGQLWNLSLLLRCF